MHTLVCKNYTVTRQWAVYRRKKSETVELANRGGRKLQPVTYVVTVRTNLLSGSDVSKTGLMSYTIKVADTHHLLTIKGDVIAISRLER